MGNPHLAAATAPMSSAPGIQAPSSTRYRILGLTFFVFFIMYMDRACVGVVAPRIMREFGIAKVVFGWSVSAFIWAYGIFQIPGGWLADRFGSRRVLSGVLLWWSAFAIGTGCALGVVSLSVIRFLFGMGEAAAFPAGSRSIVHWLPGTERAFGQGFQHAGSRLGAAIAPLMLAALLTGTSWRTPFFAFGLVGVLLALLWWRNYRDCPEQHPAVNSAELATLPPFRAKRMRQIPWRAILSHRGVWNLCALYFCYGWTLWMYLTWFPTYLTEARHFSTSTMGFAASAPLLCATFTNVAGGRLSDRLALRWNNLRRGRLWVSVAGFVTASVALIPGAMADNPWTALTCLALALAGLELTVAVSWGMSIDLGQDFSGSVSAIMNTCGALGGGLSSVAVGYLASSYGWIVPFFVTSGFCLLAVVFAFQIDPSKAIGTGSPEEVSNEN
jgi:sugar phosphate permease